MDAAAVGVELPGPQPELLGALVEPVDGFVGGGHQRDGLTGVAVRPPGVHRGAFHGVGGAAVQPAVLVVDVGDVEVTVAQAQAGVAFPRVVEAVDPVQLDGIEGVDQQPEHAAPADGGELQRVPDQHDPPAANVGQVGQLGQPGGGDHPGFVDDDGGADGEVVAVIGWPVEAVFDEQLVDRVGGDTGLGAEDVGRGRRRGRPRTRPDRRRGAARPRG